MDPALVPVVLAPALIAGVWGAFGLRAAGSPRWPVGAVAAGLLGAGLMLVAAFPPATGAFATFGIPALTVAAALLLQVLFARPLALGIAFAGVLALAILLNPPFFPLAMPLALTIPIWAVAWVDRERGQAQLAVLFLVSLVLVPALIIGAFLMIRG